jgi:hypothetical protein
MDLPSMIAKLELKIHRILLPLTACLRQAGMFLFNYYLWYARPAATGGTLAVKL